MPELRLSAQIQSADEITARDRLHLFFERNGYTKASDDRDPVEFTRGTKGAGWWTSTMTELHSTVTIVSSESGLNLGLLVDTTGQHMTDDDRDFWRRELDTAVAFALSEHENPLDMRVAEGLRVQKGVSRRRRFGIWGALTLGFIIVALGLLGLI